MKTSQICWLLWLWLVNMWLFTSVVASDVGDSEINGGTGNVADLLVRHVRKRGNFFQNMRTM